MGTIGPPPPQETVRAYGEIPAQHRAASTNNIFVAKLKTTKQNQKESFTSKRNQTQKTITATMENKYKIKHKAVNQ